MTQQQDSIIHNFPNALSIGRTMPARRPLAPPPPRITLPQQPAAAATPQSARTSANGSRPIARPAPYVAPVPTGTQVSRPAAVVPPTINKSVIIGEDGYPQFVMPQRTQSKPVGETSKPEQSPKNKRIKLISDIIVFALSIALIVGSVMFAFSNNTGKSLFGFRFYNVLTQSMVPVFEPGDMIFIKLCQPEDIEIGDIITFVPNQKYDAYLTHRVVDIIPADGENNMRFVTKGDHNNAEDPSIDSRVLVGKYLFHIPKAGILINLVRQNLVVMIITIIALFAFVAVMRAFLSTKKESEKLRVRQNNTFPNK